MSSAALSDIDMQTFVRLLDQPGFSDSAVVAMGRSTVGVAPLPIALTEGPEVWQSRDPKMPDWASPLVRHRELLAGSAMVIRRADRSSEFWKMLYMVKSPGFYLALCRLHEASEFMSSPALQAPRDHIMYSFSCNFADCATGADVVVGPTDQLQILFRLSHNGGTYVSSDSTPVNLDWLLAGQVEDLWAGDGDEQRAAKHAKTQDELVAEMLWLKYLDHKHAWTDTLAKIASGSMGSGPHGEGSAELAELDEDLKFSALADLEKARADALEDYVISGCADFAARVRGGESQVRATGEGVHAMQGQCCSKFATAWARRRGLQVTLKASFIPHGPAEAKVLTRSWCHRMQHFYDLELASAEGRDLVVRQISLVPTSSR